MKSLILAAAVAALSVSVVAPLQAVASAPMLTVQSNVEIDRKGRGCDTARDRREHPRCTR